MAPAGVFGLCWKQMFSPRSQAPAGPFTSVLFSDEDKRKFRGRSLFPGQVREKGDSGWLFKSPRMGPALGERLRVRGGHRAPLPPASLAWDVPAVSSVGLVSDCCSLAAYNPTFAA